MVEELLEAKERPEDPLLPADLTRHNKKQLRIIRREEAC